MSLGFADPRTYVPDASRLPSAAIELGRYRVRFARDGADLDAVLRLRYEVFNLELGEGLESSHATGRDRDAFDAVCHHLVVEDRVTGIAVGTYRMQTAAMAAAGLGFYSAGEFDLTALAPAVVDRSVEIGRACVAKAHRNTSVLALLWRGLGAYLGHNEKRYLFGCSSLTSQDPAEGMRAFRQLVEAGHVHEGMRVDPLPGFGCDDAAPREEEARIPILFRTYLRHGAKVCGPPAIDREFKTIDFLMLLDVEQLSGDARRLYLGG